MQIQSINQQPDQFSNSATTMPGNVATPGIMIRPEILEPGVYGGLPAEFTPDLLSEIGQLPSGEMQVMPELVKNLFNGVIRLFDHMANFFVGKGGSAFGQTPALPGSTPTLPGAPTSPGEVDNAEPGLLNKIGGAFDTADKLWGTTKDIFGDVSSGMGDLLSKGGSLVRPFLEKIPYVGGLIENFFGENTGPDEVSIVQPSA
jgi:hypothetical protein